MKSITLETERLVLREFKMEDADEVFKNWTSDPEVAKYVRWSAHKTIDDTIEYLKNVMNTYENTENFEWCITLKETGELIGAIVAFKAEDGKRYELGYNISKKHWRKGYTTEALKRVMKYLTEDLGYTSFRCSHAKENPASGAVMRKAGFKYIKDETYEKFDKSQVFDSKVYYLDI